MREDFERWADRWLAKWTGGMSVPDRDLPLFQISYVRENGSPAFMDRRPYFKPACRPFDAQLIAKSVFDTIGTNIDDNTPFRLHYHEFFSDRSNKPSKDHTFWGDLYQAPIVERWHNTVDWIMSSDLNFPVIIVHPSSVFSELYYTFTEEDSILLTLAYREYRDSEWQ